MCYSLSQQPIMGRVFARGVGFADDLNIYASLKTALKVLVEMRQRLGEDETEFQHDQSQNLHPRCHQRASSRTWAPAH